MNGVTDLEWPLLLASCLAAFLGIIVILLWFLGAFRPITFQKGKLGPPLVFVYQNHKGPYSGVGEHFEAVVDFLSKVNMRDCSTAGMYYDDPKTTKIPRFTAGFLLDNDEKKEKWNKVQDEAKKLWKIMEIKETPTIFSSFPMRWMAMSCALSAMKTYPAFEKEDFDLKSGSMEIYYSDVIETHFPQGNYVQFNPEDDRAKKKD